MTRRQKRKIVLIVILVVLLLLLGLYYSYFRATKRLDVGSLLSAPTDFLPAPDYLYAFTGPEDEPMLRPIGVDVVGDQVFVTDTRRAKIYEFTLDGEFIKTFGEGETLVPLYVALNPKDGNLYITDRRKRTVLIYGLDGTLVGEFDPKLPEDELPTFETGGVQWAPVALAFGEDGTMYFTEILNGHRLLVFSPEGEFEKSSGTVGMVTDAEQGQELFQFPNSVKVFGDRVWVADSNNRRIQIFSLEGEFEEIIVTEGLPRGIDFLAPSQDASQTPKFVVVDTLAHDGTIWSTEGEKIVGFGEQGTLEGQFSYPNDVAIGERNLIFITDSANGRVEVWGWPDEVVPIPLPKVPDYWKWCLSPFLLLPFLLLLRKKRFFATADFVEVMLDTEMVEHMPHRRRRWFVTEQEYEVLKPHTQGDVDMAELLNPSEFSESDAKAIQEKLEIEYDQAVILAIAQRAHVFCTQNEELRRYARTLEIDVVNNEEFIERFAKKDKSQSADTQ